LQWELELDGSPKPTSFAYVAKVLDVLCGGGKYFEPGFVYRDQLQNYLNAIEFNSSTIAEQLEKFGHMGGYFGNDSIDIEGPLPKPILNK